MYLCWFSCIFLHVLPGKTDYGDIGYIVPCDGKFDNLNSTISMTTIRDDVSKRIKAKHVFYVMDACYGGILVETRGIKAVDKKRDPDFLRHISKEPVRQVLTAGSANQTVLDGGAKGHSVFTGRFLEVLENADDFITASEVSTKVKEKVFSDAKTRNHTQNPQSGVLFGLGDFVFMPAITKKMGSIEEQLRELEANLATL